MQLKQAIEILKDLPDHEVRRSRVMTEFYYTRLLLEVRNVALASERAKLARVHAAGAGALAELFAEMAQGLTEVYETATRDIRLCACNAPSTYVVAECLLLCAMHL